MRFKLFISLIMIMVGASCSQEAASQTDENIKANSQCECIIGYDWVYPTTSNPSSAWKFNSDKTFSFSTTLFGGMSAWGSWSVVGPTRVTVHYLSSTDGLLPKDQILDVINCEKFTVGTTTYTKQ